MVGETSPQTEPEPSTENSESKEDSKGNSFEGLEKIKAPNVSALLCSRPNNVVSGILAGVGNTTAAALLAIGK